MKIRNHEKVELCCDIAEAMMSIDGQDIQEVTDEHGGERYNDEDQERFNLIYGAVMELIEEARKEPQLMLFVGDYIQLHNNFLGGDSDWLQVVDIEPYDLCLLSNGARVCASSEYVKSTLSESQYKERKA
jgi:hypothetical protein